MSVYQEAHKKIDQFPEETVYLFIQLMDKMKLSPSKDQKATKLKSRFLETAGKIEIDDEAVISLREASMI
ncbi:MAG: hypothetical protein IJ153_04340 [Clostridia bacterium]|nr:hypothetical protein [Clostridia bacterium]